MSAKAVLGSLVLGGVLGYAIASPVPDTQVAYIEKPPEIIVREDVVEKLVPVPLPDACVQSNKLGNLLVKEMNSWNNHARKFYKELESVDYEMITDQTANNDLVIRIHNILETQEDDLYHIFNVESSIKSQQKQCKDDIKSGP